MEADSFEAKGQVAADAVTGDEVAVHGVVSAERLEGTTVSLGLDGDTSTVGTIEGGDVTVEHAAVEEIVGREVRVGPGSHVELVRADRLDVHPDATVERTEPLD